MAANKKTKRKSEKSDEKMDQEPVSSLQGWSKCVNFLSSTEEYHFGLNFLKFQSF